MTMIGSPRGFGYGNGMPMDPVGGTAPMFGMDVPQVSPFAPAAPKKAGVNWLGVIADALSGAAGQPGQFAARQERQRAEQTAFERGEQQYRQHRADSNADWQSHQDYENTHRAPSEFDNLMDRAGIPVQDRPGYYKQALQARVDPMAQVTLPNGAGMYVGPRSGIAGALGGGSQVPPIGAEVDDPRGAGGQSSNTTGGFPFDPLRPLYR